VQRGLGAAKNGLGISSVHRVPGYANRRFQEQIASVYEERLLDSLFDLFRELANVGIRFDAGHENREFIGTEPPDNRLPAIRLINEGSAQAITYGTQ
jgi:hypothetical protein